MQKNIDQYKLGNLQNNTTSAKISYHVAVVVLTTTQTLQVLFLQHVLERDTV